MQPTGRQDLQKSVKITQPVTTVPIDYPTSLYYIDESGSKGTGGRFFVIGALKVRNPGHLAREVECVRDKHRFRGEFKFVDITRQSVIVYRDLIDVIAGADVHIGAYVIDKRGGDPFRDVPDWDAHARLVAQLVIGMASKRELATVLIDAVSTPKGIALDELVKEVVNAKFDSQSVVTSLCLDSKGSTGLQLADLVAGAVAFDRKPQRTVASPGGKLSPKGQVTGMLAAAFGVASLADVRTARVNILTKRERRPWRQPKALENRSPV